MKMVREFGHPLPSGKAREKKFQIEDEISKVGP